MHAARVDAVQVVDAEEVDVVDAENWDHTLNKSKYTSSVRIYTLSDEFHSIFKNLCIF